MSLSFFSLLATHDDRCGEDRNERQVDQKDEAPKDHGNLHPDDRTATAFPASTRLDTGIILTSTLNNDRG